MSLSSVSGSSKGTSSYTGLQPKHIIRVVVLSLLYLFLSYFLLGFHSDQLVAVGLFAGLYFISKPTRRFALGFSIFLVYWIIFNYMKAIPNYLVNEVHIASLYEAEKQHFGLWVNNTVITPNEYWLLHHNTFLDIVTGIFYLCWVPVPMLFGVLLFYRKRAQFFRFSLTFLFVNLLGFVLYYIYPAAPPWYVQEFGFTFHANTPGMTAGLQRFDDYFGAGIFKSLYSHSSNVFAAMPSLHSAYPLIVLYYGLKTRRQWWLNVFFATVMAGIWFSAVYTSHHYILDVLAGIATAVVGISLFNLLIQTPFMKRFIAYLMKETAPAIMVDRKEKKELQEIRPNKSTTSIV